MDSNSKSIEQDDILIYLSDNYIGFEGVDLNPILKPIEISYEKKGVQLIRSILNRLKEKGYIVEIHAHEYDQDGSGGLIFRKANWKAYITDEGKDYLEQRAKEKRQDFILERQSKISNRANFWSPFFAGLAALTAILAFILQLLDKPQSGKIERLQKQTITLDSVSRIHQMRIDSLSRAKKEDGNNLDTSKPK